MASLLFDMLNQLLVRTAVAVAAIVALAQFAFVQLVAAPPAVRPSSGRTPSALTSKPFRLALPGYKHSFPRDHAAHPEYSTEWWYYTGHLESRGGRRFGYELTFFRRRWHPNCQRGLRSGRQARHQLRALCRHRMKTGRTILSEADRIARGARVLAGRKRTHRTCGLRLGCAISWRRTNTARRSQGKRRHIRRQRIDGNAEKPPVITRHQWCVARKLRAWAGLALLFVLRALCTRGTLRR
jgi:hypothetical protein